MKKRYDHYIAVDWSTKNMAIARMTHKTNKIKVIDVPSDLKELQVYLKSLKGRKILVIEETTTSQWLYTELRDYVDHIIVCDPHRNRLLSEGPKTDKIDACKLVQLLKANLLKEVYHSANRFIYLRRLVSGYEDLVKAGVRWKNQRSSLLRACGLSGEEVKEGGLLRSEDRLVLGCLERQIEAYEREKQGFEEEFEKLRLRYPEIRHQAGLPGIGTINAVKIVARIVSPHRFNNLGHFLSYSGLIKLEKQSGKVRYGRKDPRYCRQLKSVYKTGAFSAIGNHNPIHQYYEYLIREKGYPEYNARHKAARKLAALSLGVFKSGKKYQRNQRRQVKESQEA